jgi:resolvase-like protein
MDWGALIGPAVVAAAVSGIVSVVGLIVSTRTARRCSTCNATRFSPPGVTERHIYSDTASGSKDERAGLASCLQSLREGDTLVVWKLDRLGRNLRHLINTVHDLTIGGIGLRVLTGQGAAIDTTTAAVSSSSASSPRSPSSSANSSPSAREPASRPPAHADASADASLK